MNIPVFIFSMIFTVAILQLPRIVSNHMDRRAMRKRKNALLRQMDDLINRIQNVQECDATDPD